MALKNYKKTVNETPKDVKIFVRHSLDILDRINELLIEKCEGKQKILAQKLGKKEAEVSKWFNGVQNFTIKTITKLEAVFGESIIGITTTCDESTFMQVKTTQEKSFIKMTVSSNGDVAETDYRAAELTKQKNNIKDDKILS